MSTVQRKSDSRGYIEPQWPQWVVRQGSSCVFIQSPTPEAAVDTTARRIGPMGGWRVGPDAAHEVFTRKDYRENAKPGDYTRSVIRSCHRSCETPREGGRRQATWTPTSGIRARPTASQGSMKADARGNRPPPPTTQPQDGSRTGSEPFEGDAGHSWSMSGSTVSQKTLWCARNDDIHGATTDREARRLPRSTCGCV